MATVKKATTKKKASRPAPAAAVAAERERKRALREHLAGLLEDAEALARDVGEDELSFVLGSVAALVDGGEIGILRGSGDAERVRTWAKKARKRRPAATFQNQAGGFVPDRTASDRHLRGDGAVIKELLDLPWARNEPAAIAEALEILSRATWLGLYERRHVVEEIVRGHLQRELADGKWRKHAAPNRASFTRAALRAIGHSKEEATVLVRDSERALEREKERA